MILRKHQRFRFNTEQYGKVPHCGPVKLLNNDYVILG